MPRTCQVCAHDEVWDINLALIRRKPYRDIARRYGVNKDAVMNHNREHLPELLAKAVASEEVSRADSLLDRIEALHRETEAVLEDVRDTDKHFVRLAAIKEMRHNLELIGEVTKELNRSPTLNLHLSQEWQEVQAIIVTALDQFPDARESVVRAIRSATHGGGNGTA